MTRVTKEEHPGPYAFPPLAALVTSGARLVLAMIEAELRRLGATYAFCDTDSIAIVGSPEVVQTIVGRFAALNPYAFGGSLLKVEAENRPDPAATRDPRLFFYGISAKRYVLFNQADDGRGIVRRGSEHGLGHLLSPDASGGKAWIDDAWQSILRWHRSAVRDMGADLPFTDLPAVGDFRIARPAVLDLFREFRGATPEDTEAGAAMPYLRQVKPFNFMMVAFPDTGDVTTGGEAHWEDLDEPNGLAGRARRLPIRPVAPYELDARKWRKLPWVDRHTGRPVVLSWGRETPGAASSAIRVQTYGDALRRHVMHPEAKSAGPDGEPCGPFTTGELSRLRLQVEHAIHIGKESHDLEEVQAGVVPAISAYVHYVDQGAEWKRDKRILCRIPRRRLAEMAGMHVRSVKAILNTGRLPHPKNLRILHAIAERLRKQG